jgi:hypothetical protein
MPRGGPELKNRTRKGRVAGNQGKEPRPQKVIGEICQLPTGCKMPARPVHFHPLPFSPLFLPLSLSLFLPEELLQELTHMYPFVLQRGSWDTEVLRLFPTSSPSKPHLPTLLFSLPTCPAEAERLDAPC